ncbi:RCC1 repeat-containing protein [Corallococcus coralloides]|uniref:RCC1 repeat-containing protein n=1 Tax=Corallococcus coralloides TaxID=184914 RepID=A0A410S4I6_CORCK|nr:RCC1 domain-containing protein [Corallococcus coralloides]QAT89089.1 RCC1 repeat-containing protein [Corallococcus coralloides]
MKRTSPRWFRSRGMLGALLLSLSSPWIAACSSGTEAPSAPAEQTQSQVTLAMGSGDFSQASVKKGRVSALIAHTDVARLRITVFEPGKEQEPIFVNFDMGKDGSGKWTGKLPFLPKNLPLTFHARAFSDVGAVTEIYNGSLDVTLTQDNVTLTVPLRPITDGAEIQLPRIERVHIPRAFAAGQSGNITFAVAAALGEALHYEITPGPGTPGSFAPLSGDLTLLGTAGAFVSQYTPPENISEETTYSHKVTVKNKAGHSVTTTFTTTVKPNESSSGVVDTTVKVLFNPVIQGLDGFRVRNELGEMTTHVIFTAKVSDDGPQSALTYAWGFTATGTPSPLPVFTGDTNPSTLQDYNEDVQGTLSLAVTDGDNGTTTLTYPLTPKQFPNEPLAEGALTGVNQLRAGENHTCALLNDGTLHCWGFNGSGQLGLGDNRDVGDDEKPSARPAVKLGADGSKIALGQNHTCALLKSGMVRCWGENGLGQLGYGHTTDVGDDDDLTQQGYINLGGLAVKIAAGGNHTCALMKDTGKVRCWGSGAQGQLGYGSAENVGDAKQPLEKGDVNLGADTVVKDITAGYAHTCALLSTGRLLCWGHNATGQLGYGDTNPVGISGDPGLKTPVDVGDVVQVAAGSYSTCVLFKSGPLTGGVKCWGNNTSGQLGRGDTSGTYRPSGCFVGNNASCSYRMESEAISVDLGGVLPLQIATGADHACALLATGSVRCWGYNGYGQLGVGTTQPSSAPSQAVDLNGATAYQITAGGDHTCALLSTGAARCWGRGTNGQLGYASKNNVGATNSASSGGNIEITLPTAP